MMGGNIQRKMVDERGDNTAVFVAYKMPPTTTRQHVSGNQANNFGQPFTTAEERKRKKKYSGRVHNNYWNYACFIRTCFDYEHVEYPHSNRKRNSHSWEIRFSNGDVMAYG